MKIKTQDLTGPALDLAVAMAWYGYEYKLLLPFFNPSINWNQGGPLIEREGIAIYQSGVWIAEIGGNKTIEGPTPLIAAMRCYVATLVGDTVDIPEELVRKYLSTSTSIASAGL